MAVARRLFAGAGWAEQHDVLLAVQEVQLAEVLDHLFLDRPLEGEVELLEGLAGDMALARGPLSGACRLEDALVSGTQLAAVQSKGEDLPLADRELDAASREAWIERVVVRVRSLV
jgi:hypothetical protein